MRNMILLLFIVIITSAASSKKNFGNLQCSEITSIYDGDSFRCNIIGVHPIIGQSMAIRVKGIDTPEMNSSNEQERLLAKKARAITVNFIENCDDKITLKNISRGKYFRIVADVYCFENSLSDVLLHSGLAYKYYGGKKKPW